MKRVSGSLLFGEKSETNISSAGPKGEFTSTYYMLTVRAFQETLDSSGQGLTSGRVMDQIEAKFLQAGERAGSFSKAHSECIQGKPGEYDLILAPAVGGNLLGGLVRQDDPIQIIIGRSPFADKIGETLAPEYVNITDNPLIPNGLTEEAYRRLAEKNRRESRLVMSCCD